MDQLPISLVSNDLKYAMSSLKIKTFQRAREYYLTQQQALQQGTIQIQQLGGVGDKLQKIKKYLTKYDAVKQDIIAKINSINLLDIQDQNHCTNINNTMNNNNNIINNNNNYNNYTNINHNNININHQNCRQQQQFVIQLQIDKPNIYLQQQQKEKTQFMNINNIQNHNIIKANQNRNNKINKNNNREYQKQDNEIKKQKITKLQNNLYDSKQSYNQLSFDFDHNNQNNQSSLKIQYHQSNQFNQYNQQKQSHSYNQFNQLAKQPYQNNTQSIKTSNQLTQSINKNNSITQSLNSRSINTQSINTQSINTQSANIQSINLLNFNQQPQQIPQSNNLFQKSTSDSSIVEICGAKGVGKSALLLYFCQKYAQTSNKKIYFINCAGGLTYKRFQRLSSKCSNLEYRDSYILDHVLDVCKNASNYQDTGLIAVDSLTNLLMEQEKTLIFLIKLFKIFSTLLGRGCKVILTNYVQQWFEHNEEDMLTNHYSYYSSVTSQFLNYKYFLKRWPKNDKVVVKMVRGGFVEGQYDVTLTGVGSMVVKERQIEI